MLPGYIPRVRYVYPACAGIHLLWIMCDNEIVGLPRMRGDPPFSLRHTPAGS